MITKAWYLNMPFRNLMQSIRIFTNLNAVLVSNCMSLKTGDELQYNVSIV